MQNDLICRSAVIDRYYAEYEKQDICDGDEDRDWLKKCIEEAPAVDAVSRLVVEHIKWERDTAIQQLKDHGIPFGGTAPDVVKVLLCAFCAKFDTSGYDNGNEDDFLLHVGYCKYWGKSTQGCGFCDRRERRADDDRDK